MKFFRFLTMFVVLALSTTSALAIEVLSGRVVGVSDGDTITVLTPSKEQHRVRLAQIDAPESKQDFGQRSKQSLSDMVFNKQVQVRVVDTDKYGRKVGTVFVGDIDANLVQVQRGMAWVYVRYAQDPAYFAAESAAKAARAGLWGGHAPVPPWEFRRNK